MTPCACFNTTNKTRSRRWDGQPGTASSKGYVLPAPLPEINFIRVQAKPEVLQSRKIC